ncbi:MAG: hypothetical protein K5988_03705 [Lachnospiraceae bacterium]|nr:hypothetical protein [Lachnospiraceae bacterium]
MKITNDTPIELIGLSARSYNSLARSNRFLVGDLIKMSDEEITQLKYVGSKSIDEIIDFRNRIISGEFSEIINKSIINCLDERSLSEEFAEVMFTDDDEQLRTDLSVKVLNNTPAKKGALLREGIDTLRKLSFAEESSIRNIKSIGNAFDVIINELAKRMIIYYPVNQSYETASKVSNMIGQEYSFEKFDNDAIVNAIRARVYEYEDEIVCDYDCVLGNRKLLTFIYRDDLVRKNVENYIIGILNDSTMNYSEISDAAPKSLVLSHRLDDIVFEMKTNNIIEESEEGYRKYLPYLIDWIREGLVKEDQRDIVRKRISGMTLEEIGEEYSVTRECIRQKEAKARKKFVRFQEERYIYWFENYSFTKEQFCEVFNLLPSSYDSVVYLSDISSRGDKKKEKDKKSITEVIDDDNLSSSMIRRLRKAVANQFILINEEFVPIREKRIFENVLKNKHSDNSIRIEDLIEEYNETLDEYDIEFEKIDVNDNDEVRRIEGIVSRLPNTIKREKKSYRYYLFENYDFKRFFESINFDDFKDMEISTQKIMVMYPELMEEYDIKACYELHDIIVKNEKIVSKYGVTRETAPNIMIGTASREEQVKRFIYKVAPISVEDFTKTYEEEYGVEAATVLGTYNDYFRPYVKEGRIIDVLQEPMRDDELFKMKSSLNLDFYFIEDVVKIYCELYPDGNKNKINHYNLKKLGFNVYSSYIINNKYNSVESYMENMILKGGIDPKTIDRRLYSIQFYYNIKEKLRMDYEILEIDDGKFITYEKFKEKYPNVSKEELKDFANKAVSFSNKDMFTVYSIRKDGFTHQLDQINETEMFYSGLIRSSKEVFFSRTKGDLFFSKTDKYVDRKVFLKYVINEIDKETIKIQELMNYLMDEYGVYIDRYDIPALIRRMGYFYSNDNGIIYKLGIDYANNEL